MDPTPQPDAFPPGTMLGRYAIVRRLGAGAMGAVYEAEHTDLHKRVAIKTLHATLIQQQDLVARFVREGRAAARIRHPNVVDVSDVGVAGGVPFLVMELLSGEDVHTLLRREGPLPIARVVDIVLPVCSALAAAHAERVVHRDLKPANIFLARTRDRTIVPKVVDFGISKVVGDDGPDAHALTSASTVLGTPSYMAPEQIRSTRDVDARSDQYSLGVVLYECLTGVLPFAGETLFVVMTRIVSGEYIAPSKHRADIPPALEQAIMRAMHLEPSARFGDVRALARALLPFASPDEQAYWARALFDPIESAARPPETRVGDTTDPVAPYGTFTGQVGNTLPGQRAPSQRPPARRPLFAMFGGASLLAIVAIGVTMHRAQPAPQAARIAPPRAAVVPVAPAPQIPVAPPPTVVAPAPAPAPAVATPATPATAPPPAVHVRPAHRGPGAGNAAHSTHVRPSGYIPD